MGVVVVLSSRTIYWKLDKLKRKERHEKDIEKKLLNSDFPINSYHSTTTTSMMENGIKDDVDIKGDFNRMKSDKMNGILIGTEDLQLVSKIGEGGFGSIYLARCWGTTDVAVKSYHQQSEEDNQDDEFEREVSFLMRLRHPNIVTLYGVVISDSKKFMVGKLVFSIIVIIVIKY